MEPLGQTTLLEELLDGSDGKVLTGRFKGFAEQEKARGYIAHASIGPSCALAAFENGELTVWTHSQGVFPLRRDLAKALKLDPDAVRCVHAEGSGCYGHNGADVWRSMPHYWPARSPGGRCGCNGCATTSSPGSLMAPRCWRAPKPRSTRVERLSTGPTRYGAIRTAPGPRHRMGTTICSSPGMSQSRAGRGRRSTSRNRRVAATVMRCRSMTSPISAWSTT